MTAPLTPEAPQGDPTPEGDPNPTPDEPLGEGGKRALDAEREARKTAEAQAKELQKQLDAAKKDGLPEWQQQINDLKAQIDSEREAREAAEKAVKDAATTQLRVDLAAVEGIPAVLAKKFTGTTEEEIKAEIAELLPHLGTPGPRPNPQQGNPSQARGGSLAAGRERYAAAHPK
ncbi:hypothetical protein [Mycolicibacterium sp.]|uniref:hypothetical protein n=1 Tax=Mycolicibacterium sp. TaxID=2320850 RepID=UPI0037C9A72B